MTTSVPPDARPTFITDLVEQVATWNELALHPHSSGTVAFRVGKTVIGVLDQQGQLDVAVPAPIRAVLLQDGLASRSAERAEVDGVTTVLHDPEDVRDGTLLLRLAYLYRRLLRSTDPAVLRRIRIEIAGYDLPEALHEVYAVMLSKRVPEGAYVPRGTPPAPTANASES